MKKISLPIFECRTFQKTYGKHYSATISLNFTALKLRPRSWLWEWGKRLRNASKLKELNDERVRGIDNAIKLLVRSKKFLPLAQKTVAELTVGDVRVISTELDRLLAGESFGDTYKLRISMHFRNAMLSDLSEMGLAGNISPVTLRYRSPFSFRSTSRGLIDDLNQQEYPIGAIPHTNLKELKDKIAKQTTSTLDQIINACISDLSSVQKLRTYLFACAELPLKIDLIIRMQEVLTNILRLSWQEELRQWFKTDPQGFLGALIICIRANGVAERVQYRKWTIPCFKELDEFFKLNFGLAADSKTRRVLACETAIPDEINMSVLLIQAHSRWNISSVLELTDVEIEKSDSYYFIQGFKGKVDGDTPPVAIGKEQRGGREALELLLWNHARLIELGYKTPEDGRLWWSAHSFRKDGRADPGHFISRFCKRHDLPRFSAEQLRNQGLFVHSLTAPLDSVRRIAGHASLRTTGGYLSNNVAHRMNSAVSLEFANRLQGEVKYALGIGRVPNWQRILIPVGDGSSCVDPKKPPHGLGKDQEYCDGLQCHQGAGCSSRRLVIDEERMKEIIETKKMYTSSWQQLLESNRNEFAAYHFPAILFNAALYRVCRTGPHAPVFMKLERSGEGEKE